VFLWIDSNVPFYGHYREVPPASLNPVAINALKDVHKRRCATCHDPRKFMPDEKSGLNRHHIGRHVGGLAGQWDIASSGMRVRHINLTHPSHSAALLAPLAERAGGWGLCVTDGRGVLEDKTDLDYIRMLESLETGVIRRKGIEVTGVKELLAEKNK